MTIFFVLVELYENHHEVYAKYYISLKKNPDPIAKTAFDTLFQRPSLGYKFEQIQANVYDMKFHKL